MIAPLVMQACAARWAGTALRPPPMQRVPCFCVITSGRRAVSHLALVAPAARKRVHAQPGSHAAGHLARVLVAARILHALQAARAAGGPNPRRAPARARAAPRPRPRAAAAGTSVIAARRALARCVVGLLSRVRHERAAAWAGRRGRERAAGHGRARKARRPARFGARHLIRVPGQCDRREGRARIARRGRRALARALPRFGRPGRCAPRRNVPLLPGAPRQHGSWR
jgi:hypothetical protein